MQRSFCNPVNGNYRYQFNKEPMSGGKITVNREAADPTVIFFKGRYYLFASMTLSVWVSDDLVSWEEHMLPEDLPLYGYAPDAEVAGEYVLFTASDDRHCSFYRTKDILKGPYEEIPENFTFTDPDLFRDEDGRLYFYWGCSDEIPIRGVELDPDSMLPVGQPVDLVCSDPFSRGYERLGEDNTILPVSEEELEQRYSGFLKTRGKKAEDVPEGMAKVIRGILRQAPYIEGVWMSRFGERYYLQYAFAGTQYNIYGDGVFESDHPLGPFHPAVNNPYSYNPGGFFPGAGHGSTFSDPYGNLWHAGTMRISVNHNFERRVGIWPAGIDRDGELFCNQRYGDWPVCPVKEKRDPWQRPEWMLLSFGKKASASSFAAGYGPEKACEEDVRTWWKAAGPEDIPWLQIDLGKVFEVALVQVNFADDKIDAAAPEGFLHSADTRCIEKRKLRTRWKLEGSADGQQYICLQDKTQAVTDLAHDIVEPDRPLPLRYLKLSVYEVPYGRKPCISGFRVFGRGRGNLPEKAAFLAARTSEIDMQIDIEDDDAAGHLVLWGHRPEKLYHSRMLYNHHIRIGALVKGTEYYVRVDSFSENGITEGEVQKLCVKRMP
jgi:hypothetical protein